MKTHKLNDSKRLIGASLILAGTILLGSLLQVNIAKGNAISVLTTTAVYMLGPLCAAIIMLPITKDKKWLYATATLMSLAIVFPWALIDTATWAQTYMAQLGHYCNILFVMIIISNNSNDDVSHKHLWVITGFFLFVLFILPILL